MMLSTRPCSLLGILLTLLLILSRVSPAFAVDCDKLEKYTDNDGEWFYNNICDRRGLNGKCLFYTKGLTQKAKKYAKASGMTTVWAVWNELQYRRGPSDPMRCILDKEPQARAYFAAMCRAYARLCDTFAQVMAPIPGSPGADNPNSFWVTVEFPAIEQAAGPGRIWQIEGIESPGEDLVVHSVAPVWTRSFTKRDLIAEELGDSMALIYNSTSGQIEGQYEQTFERRDGSCGASDEEAAAFDDCGEQSLPW